MMSIFLNPWVMAAGAGLVATPIIIHLISRIRFRRVEWAAMEFLLKAQKKMRRKKIIEQLLLLLLRILLVFLAGLLLARFLGSDPSAAKETRPVLHVVVLDDTPSMGDTGGGGAGGKDAFERAKSMVTDKLLPAVAKASTPQTLRLVRLSDGADLLNPSANPDRPADAITPPTIEAVKGALAAEKPSPVHASVVPGLKRAKELFAGLKGNETAKVVHLVSDMRSADWAQDSEAITQAVKDLTDEGVKVHLIDVAAPGRKPDRKSPAYSDNVGIVELKPRNRVTAYEKEVEFDVRVKNYGSTDLKDVRADVFVNGAMNHFVTLRFDTIPGGQEVNQVFTVTFNSTQGATVGTREDPLARFNVVTAVLDNTGADAIAADNARHAVVEVKDKLSVLLVTRPPDEDKPTSKDGDSFSLRLLFEETKLSGTDVVSGTVADLEKRDLREFSSIYLVNIPQLSKAQVDNLERYARAGGGVGVFLGPNVGVENYNNLAYRKGEGFLPFPLPPEPTPPLTKEQKAKRSIFGGRAFTMQVLLRDPVARQHAALRGIYEAKAGSDKSTAQKVEASFNLVEIDQHWPIARIGKWREDRSIQELYCLPNEQSISEFEGRVKKLTEMVKAKYGEAKFEKYRTIVDSILDRCRTLAADPENPLLSELTQQLNKLLSDQINEGDANEALLREFWNQPEMVEARSFAQSLRDASCYGDPLYVARSFGTGRVAVFTIPVCAPWTNWPLGPGLAGWVAVMTELQKYLSSGSTDENRPIGSRLDLPFEPGRYKPEAAWSYLTYDAATLDKGTRKIPAVRDPVPGQPAKKVPLDSRDGAMHLDFADSKRPGAYLFTLTRLKRDTDPAGEPSERPEYHAAVFNFDTEHEGNLKRVHTDDFARTAKGAEEVHSVEDDGWLGVLEQKPTDLSSGRWIYLLILCVLIFEQALAVRLSYHGRPDELEMYAPSAAAALAGRTAVPTGEPAAATTETAS